MYTADRTYHTTQPPASASDFYSTDQGSKMGIQHKVSRSPYRYAAMRSTAAGRMPKNGGAENLGVRIGTNERIGPDKYSPHASRAPPANPRKTVGTSAFANEQSRVSKECVANTWRIAELGFSSVQLDQARPIPPRIIPITKV